MHEIKSKTSNALYYLAEYQKVSEVYDNTINSSINVNDLLLTDPSPFSTPYKG